VWTCCHRQDGGVFVLEVNGIPGWEGLQRATGLDVAGAIVDHLAVRVASSGSFVDADSLSRTEHEHRRRGRPHNWRVSSR
jgi:hypothetical protein